MAVVVIVLAYFVYDRTRSPCDSIFEQASTQLSAKLTLLESSGDVAIGKAQLQDLSERSQMVALNLKTCCVVFDGGQLDSEQFLGCKAGASRFEAQLEQAVALVGDARQASASGLQQVAQGKAREAARQIEAAQQTAREFEQQVDRLAATAGAAPTRADGGGATQLRTPSTREPVQAATARATAATAEVEPNGSAFEANAMPAGQPIRAEIADGKDQDWYRLDPGNRVRDWIVVRVENRSSTLRPKLTIYNANKTQLHDVRGRNDGADVEERFVAQPGAAYFVQVSSMYGSAGAYAVRASLQRAYDEFEPNDDAFTARVIEDEAAIDAGIMDDVDVDWHRFTAPSDGSMLVRVDNRSSTLRPWLAIYDRDKKQLVKSDASNAGQNLQQSVKVEARKDYYAVIGGMYATTGAYRLVLSAKR